MTNYRELLAEKNANRKRAEIIGHVKNANENCDAVMARDLLLCITNESILYYGVIQSTLRSLSRKYKRGEYCPILAIQAWFNVVNSALSNCQFQHLYTYNRSIVDVPTRWVVAAELSTYYTEDVEQGWALEASTIEFENR